MYRVGVDLGGTNIAAAVIDDRYRIVSKVVSKTNLPRPAEAVCDDIVADVWQAVRDAGLQEQDIESYGIGSPGVINVEKGLIVHASTFRYTNAPLRDLLYERSGKEFYCANDANAAAYGEFIAGAGRGTKDFIAVTLGSGIGGGIIIQNKIYVGAGFAAGEPGHHVIVQDGETCLCGRKGCWEAYASATGLIRDTRRAMLGDPDSRLWALCEGDLSKVDAKTVFDARDLGDPTAAEVVRRYYFYLGTGIANLIKILQPEVLCIGGGISNQGQRLIDELEEAMKGRDFQEIHTRVTKLRLAELGNDAGLIGAAFLKEQTDEKERSR